jgi:hypothetical protein
VPCASVNHADFTSDGRRFLVSCEFSGQLPEVDTAAQRVTKVWRLDLRSRSVVAKRRIPGGGSPDMGGISADEKKFGRCSLGHTSVFR